MKTIFRALLPSENNSSGTPRVVLRSRFQTLTQAFVVALTATAISGVASAQSLQPAGDLILNLRSVDLDATNTVWTNQSINAFSVGNLHTLGGSAANVQSLSYSDSIVGNTNVNVLYVNATGNNSMVSSLQVPAEILGRGTVSAEVWIQATDVGSTSATITSATVAYGNVNNDPKADHQRDFNYCIGNGNGAVSSYADDADWTPKTFPTAGVWHYLAFTYDGTTFLAYQDGVLNTTASKPNWNTLSGVMCVGSDGATGGGDPFHGYIAAARVMSGVLTAGQIANNFNAGLLGDYGVIALTPTVAPTTNVFLGDTVTLSEVVQGNQAVTYQWQTDNGSGGAFTPISGATGSNFVLHTAGLTVGNYQYEVVVTGNNTATSPPVVVKISAASGPVIAQDITPATTANIFVGSSVTFSAAFTGNQTITNQWQVSKDNGATFQNVSGGTNSTLTLVNLQTTDSGKYRLVATNAFGHGQSSTATLTVLPASARPEVQVAGQLIVNLQPGDLNGSSAVWPNKINGIGDFTVISNGVLNVTNLTYSSQAINALAVNHNPGNAVVSAQQAPLAISGNGPVSVEAWVYPTGITGNNADVSYGVQGGSGAAPEEQRELNYNTGNNGALSGDFGNLDAAWNSPLTINTWHYLAYVYDGTNFQCYMDGALDVTKTGANPLPTVQTVVTVGANIAGSDPSASGGYSDSFQGYIANVRVATGVLNASQVANNFISGPQKTIAVVLSTPVLSPSNSVFYGDTVTISVANAQSFQALTFQWQTDNGNGGASFTAIAGATGTNYTLNTTSLPQVSVATNYEYELVATGNGGTIVTSAPVTLTIRPAAPPIVVADTSTTSSALFVGQQVTFTASFTGNQPITNQWQVSTNGGSTFKNVAGANGASLTLPSVQLTDSGEYRLIASNAFGSTGSTPASLLVLPVSAEPTVQVAGSLIVDLKPSGLDTNTGYWHNASSDPNSVGDFTYAGQVGPLNVAMLTFNSQPITVLNVAGNGDNSVEALNAKAPAILLGSNPCSMEAWIYATAVGGNNTVVNYGDQTAQSGNLDRALNYHTQPYGAFTGYFGTADVTWLPSGSGATANAWHFIAVTYDGSNIKVYQDGVLNNSVSGITLSTDDSYISVGSGTGNAVFAGAAPFSGYVASARVETGVLSASQIAQNYTAGPAPGLTVGLNIAQFAPLVSHFAGGTLTLSWASGTLQEATSLAGPWTTDTGVQSPLTVTPKTSGAPVKFYRLKY